MIVRLLVLCVGVALAAVAGYVVVSVATLTPNAPEKAPQWPYSSTITPDPPPPGATPP